MSTHSSWSTFSGPGPHFHDLVHIPTTWSTFPGPGPPHFQDLVHISGPGSHFQDLVQISRTWFTLPGPGPHFQDLVHTSRTWSTLPGPGPHFQDLVHTSRTWSTLPGRLGLTCVGWSVGSGKAGLQRHQEQTEGHKTGREKEEIVKGQERKGRVPLDLHF